MRGTAIGYPGRWSTWAPVQLEQASMCCRASATDDSRHLGFTIDLDASPEAATGGGLAILKTGDRIRVDLGKSEVNVLLSEMEIRKRRDELQAAGGYRYPASQTPWQEMQRGMVGQMDTGSILEPAAKYQRIARTKGIPRHNH